MLEGVAGEFGVAVQAHFFEDALTVGADGLDTEAIFFGDLSDGLAGGLLRRASTAERARARRTITGGRDRWRSAASSSVSRTC